MKYRVSTLTDKGNYRDNNEDYTDFFKKSNGDFIGVICDGMGGHPHGEVASKIAVQELIKAFKQTDFSNFRDLDVNEWMQKVLLEILKTMQRHAQINPETWDMGTTLAALLINAKSKKAYTVNIGDSRIYRCNQNHCTQITRDQNLWNSTAPHERVKIERLHSADFTYWKVLTSALGPTKPLRIETQTLDRPQGTYLLTTDGVHDYIDIDEMKQIVTRISRLKNRSRELIRRAKANLSTDNLTVLIVEVR